MKPRTELLITALLLAAALATGCDRPGRGTRSSGHGHAHVPPHGGAAVILGNEDFHLEFVQDASAGTMRAYVLDGHMAEFVRIAQPSFEVTVDLEGGPRTLTFAAVANSATGESVGNTAMFEASADWLKTEDHFDARIGSIEIRGATYRDVSFHFHGDGSSGHGGP